MEVLNNILGAIGLEKLTDAVNNVTGIIDKITYAISGPEVPFIVQLNGFFDNLGDVFTKLGNLNIDFSQFDGVIKALGNLFGA